MTEKYDPHSINAVLSRIETKQADMNAKLDSVLAVQEAHAREHSKLWAALGRMDVRVAILGATGGGVVWGISKLFQ